MISKDLKKLSRRELVDIIYQMKKNEQRLQQEIAHLQAAIDDKRLRLSKVGSIAEAAASITDVLNAAQSTADLYLHEIACMKEETEAECAWRIEETDRQVTRVISDGKKQYDDLQDRYQELYKKYQLLQEKVEMLEEKPNI